MSQTLLETAPAASMAVASQPKEVDTTIYTLNSKDSLETMVDFQAKVFADDAAVRYMLSSLSPSRREAYMRPYMHVLIKAAMLNGGVFQQEGDWSCAAVWLPPGKTVDNPLTIIPAGFVGCLFNIGVGGCKRMLIDMQSQSTAAKKAGMGKGQKYHYLFFIGTSPAARGRGLASHVIKARQEVAQKDNLPIWLEASSERSKRVYERCGFKVVKVMHMGVGTHDANGEKKHGGEGIRMWPMVWWPVGHPRSVADASGRKAEA